MSLERVPRSTENQRVFVHESCSNFFLSSSAFALKESSSAGVNNRISGRITSSRFAESLTVESIKVKPTLQIRLQQGSFSRAFFSFAPTLPVSGRGGGALEFGSKAAGD